MKIFNWLKKKFYPNHDKIEKLKAEMELWKFTSKTYQDANLLLQNYLLQEIDNSNRSLEGLNTVIAGLLMQCGGGEMTISKETIDLVVDMKTIAFDVKDNKDESKTFILLPDEEPIEKQ